MKKIVGHVPRIISKTITYALMSGGQLSLVVTGPRQNKRNNGLEVLCMYRCKGLKYNLDKMKLIIQDSLNRNT